MEDATPYREQTGGRPAALWDATLTAADATFTLSAAAREEIDRILRVEAREALASARSIESIRPSPDELPHLAAEVARLEAQLDEGLGFAIVAAVPELGFAGSTALPWILSRMIGETLAQNEDGHEMYLIFDQGGRMEEGARYSQTSQGDSIHTDGVNLASGYDYFLLSCIAEAAEGGESILVSGEAVYRDLALGAPELIPILEQERVWEYKGIHAGRFYRAPILERKGDVTHWRYLRNYLEEAAVLAGEPLGEAEIRAMDGLDARLDDPKLQFRASLSPGQTVVVNDRVVFHGRTAFRDAEGSRPLPERLDTVTSPNRIQRTYSRFWVNKRNAGSSPAR